MLPTANLVWRGCLGREGMVESADRIVIESRDIEDQVLLFPKLRRRAPLPQALSQAIPTLDIAIL